MFACIFNWQQIVNLVFTNIGAINSVHAIYSPTQIVNFSALRTLAFYRLIDDNYKDGQDYRNIARAFLILKKYELSEMALKKALTLSSNVSTYYELGYVYFTVGDLPSAIEAWRHAQATSYFLQLGNRSKVIEERRQYYEIAISIAPDSPEPYYTYAHFLYYDTHDRDRAIQLYEKGVFLDDSVTAGRYTALARIAQHNFDWPSALRNYSQAIALGDQSVNTYIEYGDVLQVSGADWYSMHEAYQRAQAIEPFNQWPYLRMTNLYIKNNQLSQLLEWYKVTLSKFLVKPEYKRDQIADLLGNLAQANADMGACDVYQLLVQMYQQLNTQKVSQFLSVSECE